jgi:hypothetical protein
MADKRVRRDISTVVSILPVKIHEKKPGLIPGEFKLDAVTKEGDFTLLLIERCSHAVYLDDARPRLIVPDPSEVVAQSIVDDYKRSIHGYVPDFAEPGIDWVQGDFPNTKEGKDLFAATNAAFLKDMHEKQNRWFQTLIDMADDDWLRYHRHSFITGIQRTAALRLGVVGKEWLTEQQIQEAASKCRWCFQMIHPEAVICGSCQGVQDESRYAEYVRLKNLGASGLVGSAQTTK